MRKLNQLSHNTCTYFGIADFEEESCSDSDGMTVNHIHIRYE